MKDMERNILEENANLWLKLLNFLFLWLMGVSLLVSVIVYVRVDGMDIFYDFVRNAPRYVIPFLLVYGFMDSYAYYLESPYNCEVCDDEQYEKMDNDS